MYKDCDGKRTLHFLFTFEGVTCHLKVYTQCKFILELRQVKYKKKYVYTKLRHFYAHNKKKLFMISV